MGCINSCLRGSRSEECMVWNDSVYDILGSFGEGSPVISPVTGTSTSLTPSSSDTSLRGLDQFLFAPITYDAEIHDSCSRQDGLISSWGKQSSHSHQGTEPLRSNIGSDKNSVSDGGKFNVSAGDGETREKLYKSSLGLSWAKALTRFDELGNLLEDEDVCPTCLEEFTSENPMTMTKCSHHFHLACIYEWLERSDTCPVCDKVMEFEEC